jgi:uncharacterized protein
MKPYFGLFAGLLLLLPLAASAQMPPPPPAPPRMITVSGEASDRFSPDQAILSLSLVSRDPSLARAKEENDGQVKKLVGIAQELNIPKEKIATSSVSISPEYRYDNNRQQFVGYMVTRSFQVTITDLSIHERVLSAIVDAKIDQVNNVEFSLAEPETHAAKVRIKAYENARAKASALAAAAGVKLGQPINITAGGTPPPMPVPMMMSAKAFGGDALREQSVAPSLPGMITLSESLSVTFTLE